MFLCLLLGVLCPRPLVSQTYEAQRLNERLDELLAEERLLRSAGAKTDAAFRSKAHALEMRKNKMHLQCSMRRDQIAEVG